MKNFMNYDFDIYKISIACFVPAGTGVATHRNRPNHGLAFHTSGDKEYIFTSGERVHIRSGDIIYLPKHSSYEVAEKISGDCYAINFDLSEDTAFLPFAVHARNYSGTERLFRIANTVWESKKKGYVLKCKASLYDIIYSMQESYSIQYLSKNKLEIIKCAVDYIHENYCIENISIKILSEMCDISPEYFRKIFKSFYGTSPVNYINNLKITRAKELLDSKIYSVTEAAFQSGYSDISHFSREFKKSTGISPSDYSKKGAAVR